MPLDKTLALLAGYDASFWAVCSVGVDFVASTACVNYRAYKDEATFDSNPEAALERRTLNVSGDDFATYFGTTDDVTTQAQNAIIALVADLSDATFS